MNSNHLVHGLAGDEIAPDWPALTPSELELLLRHYPQPGSLLRIAWHSPRPLSAACLIGTRRGEFFVKRHHRRVRSVATLSEEHRFMAHLRSHGVPIPIVLRDVDGASAVQLGDWTYEMHQRAAGLDLYREAVSWEPLTNHGHARRAGRMLATLHDASTGYRATQRDTHILVARSELIASPDPVAATGHDTYKLPFGHRGVNHPVHERLSGRVLVTSQNHGFAVRPKSGTSEAAEV